MGKLINFEYTNYHPQYDYVFILQHQYESRPIKILNPRVFRLFVFASRRG